MRIDELYLKNFRNVEEETFQFPSLFTVIIGMNGKGKSTLLHALRIAAGAYLLGIPTIRKRHIEIDEIRQTNKRLLIEHRPVEIRAVGTFSEILGSIMWRRRITENGKATTSSARDVGEIRQLGIDKYRLMQNQESDELNLPLIAFFGTNRVFGTARKRKSNGKPRIGRQIFKEGYHEWYAMRSGTYGYKAWLTTYEALLRGGKEYVESRDVFFNTIQQACPYVAAITFIDGDLWLSTKFEDGSDSDLLPLNLMSDGIITFVEMVAELAYRCIVLNGYLRDRAVTHTSGVVLIDEIDLHLHPKWQRQVVNNLKEAFPNLQFIVTTHSPIIVQSLETEELINLDTTVDRLEDDPFRFSLEEVVDAEMGLTQGKRSEKFLEMQQAAAAFFQLIEDNANPERLAIAKKQLDELRILFNHDPAYVAQLAAELPNQ